MCLPAHLLLYSLHMLTLEKPKRSHMWALKVPWALAASDFVTRLSLVVWRVYDHGQKSNCSSQHLQFQKVICLKETLSGLPDNKQTIVEKILEYLFRSVPCSFSIIPSWRWVQILFVKQNICFHRRKKLQLQPPSVVKMKLLPLSRLFDLSRLCWPLWDGAQVFHPLASLTSLPSVQSALAVKEFPSRVTAPFHPHEYWTKTQWQNKGGSGTIGSLVFLVCLILRQADTLLTCVH